MRRNWSPSGAVIRSAHWSYSSTVRGPRSGFTPTSWTSPSKLGALGLHPVHPAEAEHHGQGLQGAVLLPVPRQLAWPGPPTAPRQSLDHATVRDTNAQYGIPRSAQAAGTRYHRGQREGRGERGRDRRGTRGRGGGTVQRSVLITGGAGFVAAHLARRFHAAGIAVRLADVRDPGRRSRPVVPPGRRLRALDVLDARLVRAAWTSPAWTASCTRRRWSDRRARARRSGAGHGSKRARHPARPRPGARAGPARDLPLHGDALRHPPGPATAARGRPARPGQPLRRDEADGRGVGALLRRLVRARRHDRPYRLRLRPGVGDRGVLPAPGAARRGRLRARRGRPPLRLHLRRRPRRRPAPGPHLAPPRPPPVQRHRGRPAHPGNRRPLCAARAGGGHRAWRGDRPAAPPAGPVRPDPRPVGAGLRPRISLEAGSPSGRPSCAQPAPAPAGQGDGRGPARTRRAAPGAAGDTRRTRGAVEPGAGGRSGRWSCWRRSPPPGRWPAR